MKIKYNKLLLIVITCSLFFACEKWTETESINKTDLNSSLRDDNYYAALRAWKETPGLPQVYVWFDNWTGTSPTGENSLRGLPDSVTIAARWGGGVTLTSSQRADMEYVQKVKGTKVVMTMFCAKVGEGIDWEEIYDIGNSSDESVVRPALRHYAETIHDSIVANGYSGFDWDYEPNGGGGKDNYLWKNRTQRKIFVEELGYWFGKGSQRTDRDGRKPAEPNLLFIIDGEVGIGGRMDKDWESQYFDHFVLQAYGGGRLQDRVSDVIQDMSEHIANNRTTAEEVVGKTILTENFESYAGTGAGILNMASYIHPLGDKQVQIGGFGAYRIGFDYKPKGKGDYNGSPEYYFLRKGISKLYDNYRKINAEK